MQERCCIDTVFKNPQKKSRNKFTKKFEGNNIIFFHKKNREKKNAITLLFSKHCFDRNKKSNDFKHAAKIV